MASTTHADPRGGVPAASHGRRAGGREASSAGRSPRRDRALSKPASTARSIGSVCRSSPDSSAGQTRRADTGCPATGSSSCSRRGAPPGGDNGGSRRRTGRRRARVVRVEAPADVRTSASRGRSPGGCGELRLPGGHAGHEPQPEAEAAQPRPRSGRSRALERQVLTLQAETEEVRRAAEQEMERLVRDVRILRLDAVGVRDSLAYARSSAGGAFPDAPVAPPAGPGLPEERGFPVPAVEVLVRGGRSRERRSPEALVADVRAAVIEALGAPGGTLPGLGGDEFVDGGGRFVPGGLFAAHARPEHTSVVRARVKDVEARGRDVITPGAQPARAGGGVLKAAPTATCGAAARRVIRARTSVGRRDTRKEAGEGVDEVVTTNKTAPSPLAKPPAAEKYPRRPPRRRTPRSSRAQRERETPSSCAFTTGREAPLRRDGRGAVPEEHREPEQQVVGAGDEGEGAGGRPGAVYR